MHNIPQFAYNLMSTPIFQRNAAIDNVFYDTGSLKAEEIAKLNPLADIKGSVIVVPPGDSGQEIRQYERALRFLNKEGKYIRAIAVAGVGSSVLGTAALARNVADALNCDVAGVVSGYGVSDVTLEAMGGWFVFGALDRLRYDMESFLSNAGAQFKEAAAVTTLPDNGVLEPTLAGKPGFDDVTTLVDIMIAAPEKLEYLVGHSKGSLLLDYVLDQFKDELAGDPSPLFDRLKIVTMGAVVDLPKEFTKTRQYLGGIDWFGGMNSRSGLPHVSVEGAFHHLNRTLPHHMDAVAIMKNLDI